MPNLAQLRLFQLISPALPIGSFTYSQGMEWAIEAGWISDKDTLTRWLESVMQDSHTWLEFPILIRLYEICRNNNDWDDTAKSEFYHWNALLLSSRETSEFRQEEINRAKALYQVLYKLPNHTPWLSLEANKKAVKHTQLAGYVIACTENNILLDDAMEGYLWSWLENSVTVAIKLIPLGQSDGQSVLYTLSEMIPSIIEAAKKVDDNEIGASTPAMAIASSLHETQYTRLFRS